MSSSENALSSDSIRSTWLDRGELGGERAAHPLRRRVRRAQARVLVLERLQLAQPLVVLLVRRHRGVADVVRELVRLDQVGQLGPAVPGLGRDLRSADALTAQGVVDLFAHAPHHGARRTDTDAAGRSSRRRPRPAARTHARRQHAADGQDRAAPANSAGDADATTTDRRRCPSTSHVQIACGGTTVYRTLAPVGPGGVGLRRTGRGRPSWRSGCVTPMPV